MSGVVVLLPNGQQQFCDNKGVPLAGGFVYHYVPGTETPSPTYVDQALTTPNVNPIRLDIGGRATIWGNTTYRQILTDSAGDTIWDQLTGVGPLDNLVITNPTITGGTITGATISGGTITASIGTSEVVADGPNPNPLPSNPIQGSRTVAQFVGSFVDARNFVGLSNASLRSTMDDSSVIQAALNYAQSIGGATVYLGPGPLNIPSTSSVVWPFNATGVNLRGDGPYTTLINVNGNLAGDVFDISSGAPKFCQVRDLGFNCIGVASGGSLIHFVNAYSSLVDNIYMTGGFSNGIAVDGPAAIIDITDLNCTAPLSAAACIWLGPNFPVDGVNIASCNLYGAQFGILINQGELIAVVNSQIINSGQNGISTAPQVGQTVASVSMTGMTLDNCEASGIDLGSNGGVVNYISITGCNAQDCAFGIAVEPGAGTVGGVSIVGCSVFTNKQHGILIVGSDFCSVSGNSVVGNGTSAPNVYDGIAINNTTNCSVVGNNASSYLTGTQAYGIALLGTSDYCTVVGNTTAGGGTGSIQNIASGTHNVVANNTGT